MAQTAESWMYWDVEEFIPSIELKRLRLEELNKLLKPAKQKIDHHLRMVRFFEDRWNRLHREYKRIDRELADVDGRTKKINSKTNRKTKKKKSNPLEGMSRNELIALALEIKQIRVK